MVRRLALPKVKSTTRSTPSWRTSSSRRVRTCLRSFSVKLLGVSGLSFMNCAGEARMQELRFAFGYMRTGEDYHADMSVMKCAGIGDALSGCGHGRLSLMATR